MSTIESVSVIASFNTNGHIKPLYVRINSESFKVYSSYSKQSYLGLLEFQCQIIDDDILKNLVLTYNKRENIWTTSKTFTHE